MVFTDKVSQKGSARARRGIARQVTQELSTDRVLGFVHLDMDSSRLDLPEGVSFRAQNVRFRNKRVEGVGGVSPFSSTPMTFSEKPELITGIVTDDRERTLVFATQNNIYRYNPDTQDKVSLAGTLGGSALWDWHAAQFLNLLYFTNRNAAMKTWNGSDAGLTAVADSPPEGVRIIQFEGHLCVGNYQTAGGGADFPRSIAGSEVANGQIWTPALENSAFDIDFLEDPDDLMTMENIGQSLLAVYKENALYIMTKTGGPFVMERRLIAREFGAVSPDAVANLGDRHIVWGNNDFYVYDGVRPRSLKCPIRDFIFADLDPASRRRIRHVINQEHQEILWAYSSLELGSKEPDRIVAYNYNDDTWNYYPFTGATAFGKFVAQSAQTGDPIDSFDADPADIIDSQTAWFPDDVQFNKPFLRVLLAKKNTDASPVYEVFEWENTPDNDGAAIDRSVEFLVGVDNENLDKFWRTVILSLREFSGDLINVDVQVLQSVFKDPDYLPGEDHVALSTKPNVSAPVVLNFGLWGPILAVRVRSNLVGVNWKAERLTTKLRTGREVQ